MAYAKKKQTGTPDTTGADQEQGQGGSAVKVTFLMLWSSDRGVFIAGSTAELPKGIAASLIKECVAEGA